MPDHAKRIASEKVTVLARPPHEPGNVVNTLADAEEEARISADSFRNYPLMYCTHGGRRAETIWLHPSPDQEEVGSIAWFDIYRIKPGLKRKSKTPQLITLYLRNGDRCLIEGRHLEELMARLAARHVLQVWAYDGGRWPEPEKGKGVITGIIYEVSS